MQGTRIDQQDTFIGASKPFIHPCMTRTRPKNKPQKPMIQDAVAFGACQLNFDFRACHFELDCFWGKTNSHLMTRSPRLTTSSLAFLIGIPAFGTLVSLLSSGTLGIGTSIFSPCNPSTKMTSSFWRASSHVNSILATRSSWILINRS